MNNILDLTAGSTHTTDNAVKLYMPPAEAARVLAYLDQVPNPAKARQSRTQQKEALVLEALTNVTLVAAIMSVAPCFRATKVRDHLIKHKDRYNISKPPTRDTIAAILTKHGYMF
ncbi:hypothetical protein [Pseudomonas migulae]